MCKACGCQTKPPEEGEKKEDKQDKKDDQPKQDEGSK